MSFKTIPGHKGYSASKEGYIRNNDTGHTTQGGVSNRYRRYAIKRTGEDVTYLAYTHDLIALTFLGAKPKNAVVCHVDNDTTNCAASNLKYDTQSANIKQMWDEGRRDNDK